MELNDEWFNKVYDDLSREQMRLMGVYKAVIPEEGVAKEQQLQKQLTYINTLMINVLRFRNEKKRILSKGNL